MLSIESIKSIIRKLSTYNYINGYKVKFNKYKYHKYKKKTNNIYNRDMLPVGMSFIGHYNKERHICTIANNGAYVVNNKQYNSLSEAAKSVTHVRTEGMRFWKVNENNNVSILNLFRKGINNVKIKQNKN